MIGLSSAKGVRMKRVRPMFERDDFPPSDWQPSEKLLNRVRDELVLDLDAHLGSETDEANGLLWLEKNKTSDIGDRVDFPMFELYGPPCEDLACKGVLTLYTSLKDPYNCWQQCSVCQKQYDIRSTTEIMEEVGKFIDQASEKVEE